MKKFLRVMVSVLAVVVWASASVSCSRDEDDGGLLGQWVFLGDVNVIFTLNGVKHDAMEEGMMDRSYFNDLRGLSFKFEKGGKVVVSIGRESADWRYSVSGNKLTLDDGEGPFSLKYRVSGETLELIWDEITMAIVGVDDSPLTNLGISDYELIMMLSRAD